MPTFAVIAQGKVADIQVVPQFSFAPGTVVVADRGYTDYELWGRWTAQGVYFVSRIKRNAVFEAVGERPVPQNRHILRDEAIELRGFKAQDKCPYPLCLIEVYDPETGEIWMFITNNQDLGTTTIAAIYKDRWQIESFFRALKQNLKIKTFVETGPNAGKIQVWTALIAMLILRFLQLGSQFS